MTDDTPAKYILEYFKKIHALRDWLSDAKSTFPAKVEQFRNVKLGASLFDSIEHLISEEFVSSKTYIKKNLDRNLLYAEESLEPLQKMLAVDHV